MKNKLASRKFQIAVFFSLIDAVGLFMDKLTGGEFITLAVTIITTYGVSNVASNFVGKKYESKADHE